MVVPMPMLVPTPMAVQVLQIWEATINKQLVLD
jgi:hypothetical protein